MPLEIRVVQESSGDEVLRQVAAEYGDLDGLRKHVRAHPRDLLAELTLRDAEALARDPRRASRRVRTGTTYVSWRPEDLDALTPRRLRLLHELRRRPVPSIRALAKATGRDYKNVFQDLRALHSLGLVSLRKGRGGARVPRVAFERIEVRL